jgi:hypothetical protein
MRCTENITEDSRLIILVVPKHNRGGDIYERILSTEGSNLPLAAEKTPTSSNVST